jgi:hypothetical protein
MKKMIMVMMIAIAASSVAFGQTKMSKDKNNSVETQIIALEKQGWEAWKSKDSSWTRNNVTEEFLLVNSDSVSNKTQVIKSTAPTAKSKVFRSTISSLSRSPRTRLF